MPCAGADEVTDEAAGGIPDASDAGPPGSGDFGIVAVVAAGGAGAGLAAGATGYGMRVAGTP